MHPETLRMYLNTIKAVLTKENWKKYKELYDEDPDVAVGFVKLYHKLGRDKNKFNKAFELLLHDKELKEMIETFDRAIQLTEKRKEKLEKLKKAMVIKMLERKLTK